MAHIKLEEGVPGIRGPMVFSPETTKPMREFVEILLRGPQSTWAPADPERYRESGKRIAEEGYIRSIDHLPKIAKV